MLQVCSRGEIFQFIRLLSAPRQFAQSLCLKWVTYASGLEPIAHSPWLSEATSVVPELFLEDHNRYRLPKCLGPPSIAERENNPVLAQGSEESGTGLRSLIARRSELRLFVRSCRESNRGPLTDPN